MKYLVVILAFICVVFGITLAVMWSIHKASVAEKNEAKAQYELIKAHIEAQNQAILEANKKLADYELQIAKIEIEYKEKSQNFKKQIVKVETCEQSIDYLKDMLNKLKVEQWEMM